MVGVRFFILTERVRAFYTDRLLSHSEGNIFSWALSLSCFILVCSSIWRTGCPKYSVPWVVCGLCVVWVGQSLNLRSRVQPELNLVLPGKEKSEKYCKTVGASREFCLTTTPPAAAAVLISEKAVVVWWSVSSVLQTAENLNINHCK